MLIIKRPLVFVAAGVLAVLAASPGLAGEGFGPWASGYWLGLSSVAPDGTVFGTVGSSIVRLPAR